MASIESEQERDASSSDRAPVARLASSRRASAESKRVLPPFISRVALPVVGVLLALASVAEALRKAILNSMDFQWSGAHLLFLHHDPWAIYLSGNTHHAIILSQVPNYLHELYVLLLPAGMLTFPQARILWAVCNLIFVFLLTWYTARLCELSAKKTWLMFFLVLTSTPFRVTIANGQNDALALAAIALWAVVKSSGGRGLLLGVAYEKYSIPPVLVLFLLMRRRWKLLAFSLIPPVLGFLFAGLWLDTRWRTLAVEPFLTAMHRGSVTSGWANIMAVTQRSVGEISDPSSWLRMLPYLLAVLLACVLAGYLFHRGDGVDGRVLLACLMAASLACFQHQIYDFLALVFVLAVALKSRPAGMRIVVFTLVGYFWYLERLFDLRRWEAHLFVIVPSFLLLLGLVVATFELRKTTTWSEQWEI